MSDLEAALDIAFGDIRRLDDVVDREALKEICRSFYDLFGLSIRVLQEDGALLADVHEERDICSYVNTLTAGRKACGATVTAVKDDVPDEGTVLSHPCFTGARYMIVPIEYQGHRIGRFVLGPYLPEELTRVPKTLLKLADVDRQEAQRHLAEMPRVRPETAERVVAHLRSILDVLLHSSHRAHLTSEMHVRSVRAGYRELAEKTSKLQVAYDRLRELDRLKSNFLATVSHELRTPLTSIIGYSEMLSQNMAGALNDDQREFVETIHQKGEQLLTLITNLLDLNKLELGSATVKTQAVPPRALLEDILSTMRPIAAAKNVELALTLAPNLPPIAGDPVRLQQIFFNLMENAIKFVDEGGLVQLSATPDELGPEPGASGRGLVLMAPVRRAIAIRVIDNGIGIPRGARERIFEAFYQVDGSSTRVHGGAGLGLSIVKRLVDAHEGTIDVEGALGEGTEFCVTLPASE